MRPFLRFLNLIFLVSLDTLRKSGSTDMEKVGRLGPGENITCVHEKYINGCTMPLNSSFFFKNTFTPACDKHDVCYFCGEKYGWSRETCDEYFLRNMELICSTNGHNSTSMCRLFATFYYLAVRIFAEENYPNKSPLWCSSTCARESGDPFNVLLSTMR